MGMAEKDGDQAGAEENHAEATDQETSEQEGFHVVGIGSSAGGLHALQKLFSALPDEVEAAFVVIQHLQSSIQSQLPEILGKRTPMPVTEARDGEELEPGHVYTNPSDKVLEMRDGCIGLIEPEEPRKRGPQGLPIDHFLRSLSEHYGHRSIGVVLSGTGSDGTLGLRDVQGAGGMTLAQDPSSAEYGGMPRSAIAARVVDKVLPPEDLAGALVARIQQTEEQRKAEAAEEEPEQTLERILDLLAVRADRDFHPYKRSTVRRRIERRMGINQIEGMSEYLERLREDEEEARRLADEMLVGVTRFFREEESFEALKSEAIRPMLEEKTDGSKVRAWVCGCASGEEAYSLAMVLSEEFEELRGDCKLQIFGSDIGEQALEYAREGIYPENISADVSAERLQRFFERTDSGYRVNERIRDSLVFAPHDLLNDPPFSNMDLITCRNLLIYLRPEAQERVVSFLAFGLNPGGHLFLGRSDSLAGHDEMFDVVSREHRIYRRNQRPIERLEFPAGAGRREPGHYSGGMPRGRTPGENLPGLNRSVLLAHFDAGVVLAHPDGDIRHFFGPTEKFLHHPTGEASLDLFEMVDEDLSPRLERAVQTASEESSVQRLGSVPLSREQGRRTVEITVRPVPSPRDEEPLVAVIFEETEPQETEPTPEEVPEGAAEEADRARQLRDELKRVKEDYRATVEELETSNEELRAANEEVTSMNEELQSTNEELQSSKEELQSMNEELSTVNDELNEKVGELREAHSDLANLFEAIDVPIIYLDTDIRIKRASPAARTIFNVQESDGGRLLTDITHKLGDEEPCEAARQVLEDLSPIEKEVRDEEGNWYVMRIVPNRTPDHTIDGVVMVLQDVTRLKEIQRKLQELNQSLEQKVEERTKQDREKAKKLGRLTVQLTEAEERERHRIAELLHDELQQNLVLMGMKLKQLTSQVANEETVEGLENLHALARQSLESSRSLASRLCPPVLHERGLAAALRWLGRHSEEHSEVEVEVDADSDGEVGDTPLRVLLFRCTQELVTNALKHSHTDKLWLKMRAENDEVIVEVRDRGAGFEVEEARKKAEADGGFGIFSVRERMEALDGRLELETAPGEGTTARLVCPPKLAFSENVMTGLEETDVEGEEDVRRTGEKLRVLVADDHAILRDGLVDLLRRRPEIEVVGETEDGAEAVEKCRELRPEVVVMDVSMPRLSGIEATERINKEMPGVRIVALSVHAEDEIVKDMLEAGADSYVTKDEASEKLVACVLDEWACEGRDSLS